MAVITSEHYLAQLIDSLPPGEAWPREPSSVLSRLLSALAEEFARVHARVLEVIEEADPRTTSEMLADFERVLGLPDACVSALSGVQTPAQRRAAVVALLFNDGGQSPAFFIALAAALGYTITITEFSARTVDDTFDDPINGEAWNFAWQVNAPAETVVERTVDDTFDDPLAWWGNSQLECVINRVKPAHSVVLYSYS